MGRYRTSPFVNFPEYNLGATAPAKQPKALVSMGQLTDGGRNTPMQASVAQQPQQQQPQQPQQPRPGSSTGKTILGMPKDRFIGLMGTIAQALGGDSASGRLGEGLVNMAGMMRGERMEEDKAREARKSTEKKYAGDVKDFNDIYGRLPSSATELMDFKKATTIKKKAATPKGTAGFKQIEGTWHKGFWHLDSGVGEYVFSPIRIATRPEVAKQTVVEPPAGKKLPTPTEKRAQRKELMGLESTIRGADAKTGKLNIEHPESEIHVRSFNELSDEAYVYQRVPEIPREEKSLFGVDLLRPDVKAVPATLKKIPISQFKTPEEITDADYLSDKAKRRLLLKRFPEKFE